MICCYVLGNVAGMKKRFKFTNNLLFVLTNFCIFIFYKKFSMMFFKFTADFLRELLEMFSSVVIVQLLSLAPVMIYEEFSSKMLCQ